MTAHLTKLRSRAGSWLGALDRYLLREAAATAAALAAALLLLLVAKLLMQQLGYLMEGKFPAGVLLGVLAQKLVAYVVYVLPLLALLAAVVALSRLGRDLEMTALAAAGYPEARLLRPLGLFAAPLLLLLAYLALELAPAMAREARIVSHQARLEAGLDLGRAGRFLQPRDGRWALHARAAEDGAARGVFFAAYDPRAQRMHVEFAQRARLLRDGAQDAHVLHFEQGRRYSGWPGDAGFHRMEYARHQLRVEAPAPEAVAADPKYWPWSRVWAADTPAAAAERQWRLSLPVSLALMLLLAAPLARGSARAGKYAGAAYAIVIYLVYVQMQILVAGQVRSGSWPAAAGLPWVHALMALGIALLYVRARRRT